MLIQKAHGDLKAIQSRIAIPILSEEIITQNSKSDFKTELSEAFCELRNLPWVLLELAAQYYYFNLLGKNHPLCRMLYFSDAELRTVTPYIQSCFENVTFSRIRTDIAPYEVWKIKVNGISDFGIEVIKQIKIIDSFTAMLYELYIGDTISSFSDEEGLYECLCDKTHNNYNSDSSMQKLIANKYLRSIDVTNLDISHIAQNDSLNKMFSKNSIAYIYIDKFSPSVKLKTLCWV